MTELRRFLLIVNPAARKGRGRAMADAVAADLHRHGHDVTVEATAAAGDARQIAADAARNGNAPDCIVACGGDGTLQEVAGALAEARRDRGDACPLLGLAPAGRCNDFGKALGIRARPDAISSCLREGSPGDIDLGRIGDRYFCTVATVGIDAEISRFVHEMKMPLQGTPAYLYGAIRVLMRYRPRVLRLEGDFGVIEQAVFVASTANTSTYGGSIRIAPAASPCDGKLNVCVIDSLPRWRALMIIPVVLLGRHTTHPCVRFVETRRLSIQCDPPVELWADGEPVGHAPTTIEVVPSAVRILLPTGSPLGHTANATARAIAPVN